MHAAKKKDKVRLTDEEWNELGDKVWVMRSNDPAASLIQLANRAIAQFPNTRQRSFITSKDVERICQRVQDRDQQAKDDADSLAKARQRIDDLKRQLDERQTAEELLTNATDAEVLRLFKDRVLNLISIDDILRRFDGHALCMHLLDHIPTATLVGAAAQVLTTELLGKHNPAPLPPPSNVKVAQIAPKQNKVRNKKPKVVVAGLQQKQTYDLARMVPGVEITAIEGTASQSSIPQSADLYISWTKFMRHSSDHNMKVVAGDGRFARCSGGMSDLAGIIKNRLQ